MLNTKQVQPESAGVLSHTPPIRPRCSVSTWQSIGLLVLLLASSAIATEHPPFVPGRILLQLRPGAPNTNLPARLARRGGFVGRTLPRSRIRVVTVPEEQADSLISDLRNDPDTEYAERDFIGQAAFTPDDAAVISGSEWHLAAIHAESAWDFTAGRTNVWVAVLDSGVNPANPDLGTQVDPGYDFVNNSPEPTDDLGHGTAVAGAVAAAGNNGIGVAGVAFGCRLLPVKVMDASGFAAYSTIAEGIRFAVEQGARVINISIVGSESSATLQEAIDYAWSNNVIVVAAAGNNGNNVPQFPAACDHVVAVSATEPDGSLAWFSSFGTNVALSAPGDTIWTTQNDTNAPFGPWTGTSLASPLVAGVAALVISENPSLSAPEIVAVLQQTAHDLGVAGWDSSFGFGQVDAYAAVYAASQLPGALPASPPVSASSTNPAEPGFGTNNSSGSLAPALTNNISERFGQGLFAGLMSNTNQASPANSGYFRIRLTASGRFTGKLSTGGRSWGFHGAFDTRGGSTVAVRRGALAPLQAQFSLSSTNNPDQVVGLVSGPGWTSQLSGDRNVFNARWHPAEQAGRSAFTLTREENSTTVANGLSVITRGGLARIHGRLSNGHAFSAASLLAPNGDCPLYLSFNRGDDAVIGWLNFPASPAQTSSGTVLWIQSNPGSTAATLQAASLPMP